MKRYDTLNRPLSLIVRIDLIYTLVAIRNLNLVTRR